MFHILVIDDDITVNNMIVDTLTNAGYKAEGVFDGKDGLTRLTEKEFDLIITDVIMPEKEGFETIREIRKTNETVPIIAISGGGRIGPENYLEIARKAGANYTFQKPFQTAPFITAIRDCLS
jgi:DNA-binding response OmpR family regulator